jgi:hypothetical protein
VARTSPTDGGAHPSVCRLPTSPRTWTQFSSEGNVDNLTGVPEPPLPSSVALNTPDSAGQQVTPDAVAIRDKRVTQPALRWSDGAIGGITAGTCRRIAELGGIPVWKAQAPRQLAPISWGGSLTVDVPPAPYGLVSTARCPAYRLPGTAVSQTIRLDNLGVHGHRGSPTGWRTRPSISSYRMAGTRTPALSLP